MPLSNIVVSLFKVAMICALIVLVQAPWQIGRTASGSVIGHVSCGGSGISIDIDGEIDAATFESVSRLFEERREQRKKVASGVTCDDPAERQNPLDLSAYGDHFGINSGGGSVTAAMAIGRMLRREGAWIGVNGVCFSACVFILAGAVDRQIGRSDQVGIHRPYLRSTPEKPLAADQVMQAYSRMLQDMRAYLREMNVSQRLADDMLATEPENNHILTETELKAYRLAGVDPAEQQRRAIQKETADVQEANQLGLDRREYTEPVPEFCTGR
jgi:ATP-dependent protease ClpP protease subunit